MEEQKSAGDTLNEKQRAFAELYAYSEWRGNGVQCYAVAYEIDLSEKGGYNTAKSNAHRLLTNADILTYIRQLYSGQVLNDEVVDNELAFLISQNADFGSKLGAIKEYNSLKQRIKQKIEHSGEVKLTPQQMTDDELRAKAAEIISRGSSDPEGV